MDSRKLSKYVLAGNIIWNTIDIVVSYSFSIKSFYLSERNSTFEMLSNKQEKN